jgi:predicted transcriptional regulator
VTTSSNLITSHHPRLQGDLLSRTGLALGLTPSDLAKMLGASRRSVSRWMKDGTYLSHTVVVAFARMAYPREKALAAELAALAGHTLASLGLEATPVHATVTSAIGEKRLGDLVVHAAAEAMDASPRAVRPALVAAAKRAKELGLTLEALEAILGGERSAQSG